ncbi:MAG TPA: hypothetical protein VFS43_34610 [Polyangiaceae bacterium]|nr:hypothetical protein [Polyangiaceae bacterium]
MGLFTCRNCIHNPAQGLTFGPGPGFCLQWGALLKQPDRTTCKYLHRKDLPHFLVREAQVEHEAEFAANRALADVETHDDVPASAFDDRALPRAERIDPVTRAVANYYTLAAAPTVPLTRRSRLITLFAGSRDARRASAHACLVRGMGDPQSRHEWFRRILGLIEEVDIEFVVSPSDLIGSGEASKADVQWEIANIRLAAVQEYGWHLGREELKFPLNSELEALAADQKWDGFMAKLGELKGEWADQIWASPAADALHSRLPLKPAPLRSDPEPRFEGLGLRDRWVQKGASSPPREQN